MPGKSSITIPFIKAAACGNDFLIVDPRVIKVLNRTDEQFVKGGTDAEMTRRMCDRHDGIGADGIEWLFSDTQHDARITLINADGSPAEISGNGTRCVAAHLVAESGKEKITIRTDAGVKTCTLISRSGNEFEFETAMGEPETGDPFTIKMSFGEVTGVPVSMGNPHFVKFVDEFKPGWQSDAAEIGRHHDFKHGMNVELVRVDDRHRISALFFERGAGETQSSGTGSCAAAVAAIATGRADSPVEVRTQGGPQTVRWDGQVFLRGMAHLICRGEFFL